MKYIHNQNVKQYKNKMFILLYIQCAYFKPNKSFCDINELLVKNKCTSVLFCIEFACVEYFKSLKHIKKTFMPIM